MAGSPSNQDYFDMRKIRRLLELMNEFSLTEIDLRQGDARIQLRRGGETYAAPPLVRLPETTAAPIAREPRRAGETVPGLYHDERQHLVGIGPGFAVVVLDIDPGYRQPGKGSG